MDILNNIIVKTELTKGTRLETEIKENKTGYLMDPGTQTPGTSSGMSSGTISASETVSITRCNSYDIEELTEGIKKCVGMLGGFKKFIGTSKKIILKPNLLSASNPDLAVTTHPAFIEAIINIIKKVCVPGTKIIIADSPGVSTPHTKKDLKRLYKECGLSHLGEMENVELNLDTGFSEISFKEGKVLKHLEIIKPVLEADLIINMPKFKTHNLTKITGAVKNMFGSIYGRTKTLLHTKFMDIAKFSDMNLDVYLYCKPALNVMDGVISLEGEGPGASGKPRNTGLILAAINGIALDNVVAELMGFKRGIIPLLQCAAQRGIKGAELEEINILGGELADFACENFILPKKSPVDAISKNRFLNTYIFPFIRNNLSLSPYENIKECTMCKTCIEVCPEKAISEGQGVLVFDYKKCIRCFCCSEMCPYGAIDLKYSALGNLIFGRKNIK